MTGTFVSPFAEPDHDLVEAAAAFAREHVAPNAEDWERTKTPPVETVRAGAKEFGGLLVAKEKGGLDASFTTAAHVLAELARADLAFGFSLVVHINLASALSRLGSRSQRETYLERLLRGEMIGAFCLTEPGAGTDAGAIGTFAAKADQGWTIEGRKAWVTNCAFAGLFSVYAQTREGAGADGIATFLVEESADGFVREGAYEMFGAHAMGTGGLRLERCMVPERALMCAPGEGFKAAMRGIDLARVVLSAMCCGMLEAGLEHALVYAGERRAFGRPVIEFQGLQWQLADVATELEAARLLTYRAAALLDAGENATVAAAHAKKFATRAAYGGLTQAMQAMGAKGMLRDEPFARMIACAKMAQYLDGTTEVQNVVIGRSLKC